jgi:hypothetical protein
MATEEKPSRNEEEYFAKLNEEMIKERRASLDAARAQNDRKAHFMKCPKCGGELKEFENHKVKIEIRRDLKDIEDLVEQLPVLSGHAHT